MKEINLSSVLYASPFDPLRTINNMITEDVFFDELFYKCEELKKQEDKLYEIICDKNEDISIVTIDGYSGIGKTTFIRSFVKRFKNEINTVVIDFHHHPTTSNSNYGYEDKSSFLSSYLRKILKILQKNKQRYTVDQLSNPLLSVIKSYLHKEFREKPEAYNIFIDFILKNIQALAPYITPGIISCLKVYNTNELFRKNIHIILNNCFFNDSFFFLFTFLFLNNNKEKNIIVFDNLDAVNIECLTDYFESEFSDSFINITKYSTDLFPEIDFLSNYKFVFCLRDGNSAIINPHISGMLIGRKKKIYHRINYNTKVYKEIISKRIDFFNKNVTTPDKINEASDYKIFFEKLCEDIYYKEVLIPLFNGDLRKLTNIIYTIFSENKTLYIFKDYFYFNEYEKNTKYLTRGTLLFHVLKILFKREFLSKYPFMNNLVKSDKISHINYPRSVLTVLTNLSGITYSNYINEIHFKSNDVLLYELLHEIPPIYKNATIFEALYVLFSFHEKDWVNLVTFRNLLIKNKKSFYKNILDEAYLLREEFNEVTVTLNPSGFIYLKYVVTHYEFFSILCGNENSLFTDSVKKDKNGYYIAIISIKKVYKLVLKHVEELSGFYKEVIEKEFKNRREFKKSLLTFKHFGSGTPAPIGLGQTTRIITTIISYLDTFRYFEINKLKEQKNDYELEKFNKQMVLEIESFNNLINKSEFDDEDKNFYIKFKEKIDVIKKNKYYDNYTIIGSIKYYNNNIIE